MWTLEGIGSRAFFKPTPAYHTQYAAQRICQDVEKGAVPSRDVDLRDFDDAAQDGQTTNQNGGHGSIGISNRSHHAQYRISENMNELVAQPERQDCRLGIQGAYYDDNYARGETNARKGANVHAEYHGAGVRFTIVPVPNRPRRRSQYSRMYLKKYL